MAIDFSLSPDTHITEEATDMLRSVVRGCVDLGMNVVSGGARGADQAAMQEAFSVGGKVIGALPCDLLKACLDPSNRDALAGGNALLFSAFDPEERPFRYGQVAMDRNKYIHGMPSGGLSPGIRPRRWRKTWRDLQGVKSRLRLSKTICSMDIRWKNPLRPTVRFYREGLWL